MQEGPLLATKLYIPPVRPELVPRPRLIERLNAGLRKGLLGLERSGDVTEFIKRCTGSGRYVQDYLAEEVLQQQPKGTREFLFQTSILDRFSASLCDAVRFGIAESPGTSDGTAVRFGIAESPGTSDGTAV